MINLDPEVIHRKEAFRIHILENYYFCGGILLNSLDVYYITTWVFIKQKMRYKL